MSCCTAYNGALATTNSDSAVLVLALPASAPVSVSDVSASLQGGATGTVMDVQPFPDQSSTYLIEVGRQFTLFGLRKAVSLPLL